MADDDEVAAGDHSPRRFQEAQGPAPEQLTNQERRPVSEEIVVEELEAVAGSEVSEFGGSEVPAELGAVCAADGQAGAEIGGSVGKDEAAVESNESGVAMEVEPCNAGEGGVGSNCCPSELEGAEPEKYDQAEDVKSTAFGIGTESQNEPDSEKLHLDVKSEGVVAAEDYHMNDAFEEKTEESEKNVSVEQCEASTVCGGMEQVDDSKKTVKEEGVEENVAGISDLIGGDPTGDVGYEHKGELPVAVPEIVIGEQETTLLSTSRPIVESEQVALAEDDLMEDASTSSDEDNGDHHVTELVEDIVHSELMNDQESPSSREVNSVDSAAQGKVDDILSVAEQQKHVALSVGLDHIDQSDKPKDEGGDEDAEMRTEEENIENEEKVKEDLSAVPDLDFSLQNVELDPTIGEDEIDEEFVGGEDPSIADEVETQIDITDAEKGNAPRKRGRKPVKAASTKKTEEDVCFICFDGGDLVVCDRRGCPKVYHPSCVNRDEAFFRSKGRWNCGWHLCSICEKNAQYMCFTCTFSLCKACIKSTVFYSVRGNKGFCDNCMKTVNLIESNEQGNNEAKFDFDDKNCWEYLFKDYWIDVKGKLQLTSEELAQAKNPLKGSEAVTSKQESADETYNIDNNADSGSNNSSGNAVASTPKKKKSKKRSKSVGKGEDSASGSDSSGNGNKSKRKKTKKQVKSLRKRGSSGNTSEVGIDSGSKWASSELLKFVMHMRNGDASVLSQFEVQELLLEYIKTNKLRDPRRKSQIICDAMLKGLFRKQRVGHFEMLKLLELHFLMREDQQNDFHGSSVDNESSPLDETRKADVSAKTSKDKKRKMHKKRFGRGTPTNIEDYAAIDIHNVSLVFLRRNLMEILLEDVEKFQEKVVGAFVRIRITGINQIQDMYRLVQIVGTTKAPVPYKVGKRTTDINLEIQNLNKKEVVSMDIISNQEFTEDECNRLRQSIKCGLIPPLTVGYILEKAMDLQAARVNDWLETEMVRLSHLCDRASDMGRRKELRENVEKLQNLKKPEERQRRLEQIPEVHSDPKMDPSYESEEDEVEAEDRKQENFSRPMGSSFSRQGKETLSPRKGSSVSSDSWSGAKGHSVSGMNRELGRSLSVKGEDTSLTGELNRDIMSLKRSNEHESITRDRQKGPYSSPLVGGNSYSAVASEPVSGVVSDTQTAATVNESEKIWHYKDPSGKVQGPFSLVQLKKWNTTGFFPKDLTIWRTSENEDDGILLLDALAGKFQKETKFNENQSNKSHNVQIGHSSLPHSARSALNGSMGNSASPSQISTVGRTSLSVDVPMANAAARGSGFDSRNDSTNLPSPTPNQTPKGSTEGQAFVDRVSSFSRSAIGSLSADSTQLDRLTATSVANAFRSTYNQQPTSTGYHLQQPDPSAASVNSGVESRNSAAAVPSIMQSVALQQPGHSGSNNQIPFSASNTYNQWGNPTAVSTENPGGSFPNQGFLGMPVSTAWRPPTLPVNQPGAQAVVLPDQSWRAVPGNPNMGWGGVLQANANVSWTPTGQVAPQVNPNWAVQGMGPVTGSATAGWMAAQGHATPGFVAPGNNQAGAIMNPSWAGGAVVNANSNQAWAAAGHGSMPNSAAPNNNSQGSWVNGQNGSERYANDRTGGGSSGRQWNNRRGEGSYHQRGGSGAGPTRVCDYYMSGRCKKGASCNWLHPQRQ
uniref:Zinc finger CCCH domain-containing protein 19 n=1 Tax=Kalanchoe fedtschenkoi TaxID=63787 RepID=A0A7N0TD75_KALFE